VEVIAKIKNGIAAGIEERSGLTVRVATVASAAFFGRSVMNGMAG